MIHACYTACRLSAHVFKPISTYVVLCFSVKVRGFHHFAPKLDPKGCFGRDAAILYIADCGNLSTNSPWIMVCFRFVKSPDLYDLYAYSTLRLFEIWCLSKKNSKAGWSSCFPSNKRWDIIFPYVHHFFMVTTFSVSPCDPTWTSSQGWKSGVRAESLRARGEARSEGCQRGHING